MDRKIEMFVARGDYARAIVALRPVVLTVYGPTRARNDARKDAEGIKEFLRKASQLSREWGKGTALDALEAKAAGRQARRTRREPTAVPDDPEGKARLEREIAAMRSGSL